LFERLRELRKRLADERDVPAYIVFFRRGAAQMARNYPEASATSPASTAWAKRSCANTAKFSE